MRLLFLTSYYPHFLRTFYASNPDFAGLSYARMLDRILGRFFADTGSIYHHALKHGHEAFLIIVNCEPLQKKWAEENGMRYGRNNWEKEIALAQIRTFLPDVFYIESVFDYYGDFLRAAKPFCGMIVSWISTPYSDGLKINDIDLFISSTPAFVDTFRKNNITSEYMLPAFDTRVPALVSSDDRKDIPFSFIGGWGEVHVNRKRALEQLVQKTPIRLWGYGYVKQYKKRKFAYYKQLLLPEKPPILEAYNGEVWGLDMYAVLRRSLITFNIHESLLQGRVGNMRMFEATGVGTMLLNDNGSNLSELFVPGKEIETYNTVEEAVEKVNYFIGHPDKALEIGNNGQQRTMREYNYDIFIEQLTHYCQRGLRLRQ
jgi:spore maturation protein CgeB